MNVVNLLLAQNLASFVFVKCRFASSPKLYTYKTTLSVLPGDLVIVHTNDEFKSVEVVEVSTTQPELDSFDYKWIVSKLDLTHYYEVTTKENNVKKALLHAEAKSKEAEMLSKIPRDTIELVKSMVRI